MNIIEESESTIRVTYGTLQKDEDYVNHLGLPQLHGTCPMTVVECHV